MLWGNYRCLFWEWRKTLSKLRGKIQGFLLQELMAFRMLNKHKLQQNTKDWHMSSVKIRTRHNSRRDEVPDLYISQRYLLRIPSDHPSPHGYIVSTQPKT